MEISKPQVRIIFTPILHHAGFLTHVRKFKNFGMQHRIVSSARESRSRVSGFLLSRSRFSRLFYANYIPDSRFDYDFQTKIYLQKKLKYLNLCMENKI